MQGDKNNIKGRLDKYASTNECITYWRVAKFYGRLRLVRSVLRASKFSVLKLTEIVILLVYYTIPFGFSLFLALFGHHFSNTLFG